MGMEDLFGDLLDELGSRAKSHFMRWWRGNRSPSENEFYDEFLEDRADWKRRRKREAEAQEYIEWLAENHPSVSGGDDLAGEDDGDDDMDGDALEDEAFDMISEDVHIVDESETFDEEEFQP